MRIPKAGSPTIGLASNSPLVKTTDLLGKAYIETIYDLTREYTAWKRVQQMDRNQPAYQLAVGESQRRIVAIVQELNNRAAKPLGKQSPVP